MCSCKVGSGIVCGFFIHWLTRAAVEGEEEEEEEEGCDGGSVCLEYCSRMILAYSAGERETWCVCECVCVSVCV